MAQGKNRSPNKEYHKIILDFWSGIRVETEQAIKKFGSDGLRTLVFGYKNITKGEYDEFANMYSVAKKSIVNRVK